MRLIHARPCAKVPGQRCATTTGHPGAMAPCARRGQGPTLIRRRQFRRRLARRLRRGHVAAERPHEGSPSRRQLAPQGDDTVSPLREASYDDDDGGDTAFPAVSAGSGLCLSRHLLPRRPRRSQSPHLGCVPYMPCSRATMQQYAPCEVRLHIARYRCLRKLPLVGAAEIVFLAPRRQLASTAVRGKTRPFHLYLILLHSYVAHAFQSHSCGRLCFWCISRLTVTIAMALSMCGAFGLEGTFADQCAPSGSLHFLIRWRGHRVHD